jgi:hypothetical protein
MATGFRNRRVNDIAVVRLTHKYAEMIDDVDLSRYHVGDTLELRGHDASLLIAEGWAEPVAERRDTHLPAEREIAADSVTSSTRGGSTSS